MSRPGCQPGLALSPPLSKRTSIIQYGGERPEWHLPDKKYTSVSLPSEVRGPGFPLGWRRFEAADWISGAVIRWLYGGYYTP